MAILAVMPNSSVSKMLCLTSLVICLLAALTLAGNSPIGICYGLSGGDFSSPAEVVSICKSFKITRIRLYEPNHSLLEVLRGSNIIVTIGVKNEDIHDLAESREAAHNWVKSNISPYWPDVRIRSIVVGNEAIPGPYSGFVLRAISNLDIAIGWKHGPHIKITTAISSSSITRDQGSHNPSTAAFHKEMKQYMVPIVHYLNISKTPLLANVHPYFTYIENPKKTPIGFAISNPTGIMLRDGAFEYGSLFDILVDSLYVSLEKIGGSDVQIIVSETGWPRKKNSGSGDIWLAERYYKNIIERALQIDGTTRRPGKIETYLFAMFDETKMIGLNVEKHWGLFDSNKELVYNISFKI